MRMFKRSENEVIVVNKDDDEERRWSMCKGPWRGRCVSDRVSDRLRGCVWLAACRGWLRPTVDAQGPFAPQPNTHATTAQTHATAILSCPYLALIGIEASIAIHNFYSKRTRRNNKRNIPPTPTPLIKQINQLDLHPTPSPLNVQISKWLIHSIIFGWPTCSSSRTHSLRSQRSQLSTTGPIIHLIA